MGLRYTRITAIFSCALASTTPALAQQRTSAPPAQRILSIGGDITEVLYELGASDRVVAVDTSSQFPPDALKLKKNVGYIRALSPEGVLSVAPDLVIASDRAGPPEIVRTLKSAVTYVEVPESQGVAAKIRAIGVAIGDKIGGDRLAARVTNELAVLEVDRKRIEKPLRALFVLSVQSGRATVGGSGTSADAILKLSGLDNAASDIAGFKPVSDEALHAMQPDVVVTMRRSTGGGHDSDQVLELAGLSRSPARENRRVIETDGRYLLGFGPRVASAARDLMLAAYPGLVTATQAR